MMRCDLRVQLLARHTVTGYAVAEHTAEPLVRLEDGAGMTHAAQLVGGRQTGGTAADDSDFLAGIRTGHELVSLFDGVVADVLLDRVDADEIFHLVAVAAVLARRRTDPAHHGREGIGVGGAAERVLLPVHTLRRLLLLAHDRQPAANVLTGRAATLTGRRLVDVGRTLVGSILVEDLLGQVVPSALAILVPAPGKLGVHLVAGSRH